MTQHKKIFVNGTGWSGSSAFIDLLNNKFTSDYVVIPGEFDDFRVPGTMRDAMVSGNRPISHRRWTTKAQLKFLIRALIPDIFWPRFLPGQQTNRKMAYNALLGQFFENMIFKRYGKNISIEPNIGKRKAVLHDWISQLCKHYGKSLGPEGTIFIEQFLLFDDCYENYDWLEFDYLFIFLRAPAFQLKATQESEILYSDYPWQADFLLGGYSQKRKYEVFLDTTMLRYDWILQFVSNYDPQKVIFIDFDGFLNNFEKIVNDIEKITNIDLSQNLERFDIDASRRRNLKWDNDYIDLQEKIDKTEGLYQKFLQTIQTKYTYLR